MQYEEVLEKLEFLKNKKFAKGMSRFGIKPKIPTAGQSRMLDGVGTKVYGIPVSKLRKIAKSIGKNHSLALKL